MKSEAFHRIHPSELDALLSGKSRTVVIDVRNDDYGVDGYYKRSVNVPIDAIVEGLPDTMAMLGLYDTIVCYCMLSQQRGPAAARILSEAFPHKTIYLVSGGFKAMRDHYGPLGQILGDEAE